jgi:dipeptidyl-peptidase-3
MSLPAYVTPRKVPFFRLQVAKAFAALTPKEKLYAHHLNTACWHGTSVCSAQVSAESPTILKFLFTLFSNNSVTDLRAAAKGVDADEFEKFLEYAALFYVNMGNYKSFGDSKFIPACDAATFSTIVESATKARDEIQALYKEVADRIYSVSEGELALGFPPGGRTAYYSADITKDEVEKVDAFLKAKRIEQWNTRVWKAGEGRFEVLVPCADARRESFEHEGVKIDIVRGDHAENFKRIVASMEQALQSAATEEQRNMITTYIKHFRSGDIEDHKESQRHWVQDKGPSVETNIGFIETYRDPQGVRAEWEGFVAVVDKLQSEQFAQLVNGGEGFITKLPWGKDFEKEVFRSPDFTSLEVLGFASSGVPLGICIPNYDDVRQNTGFKNVILGNSASAINFSEKMNHLSDADWELYKRHFITAISVNVGVHELLGHGTGKLFSEDENGKFNFEKGAVLNPLTGKPVDTWYRPGETWGSVFGGIANAYEECRAEAVALYLALNRDILKIFGRSEAKECAETVHVVWLNMVRGGLIGLEFYTPETKQWRQAHVRARYCILQTLLRGPKPLVNIDHDAATDKLDITIDASRIETDGKAAIGELLRHLNINKSIADAKAGRAYFEDLTAVDDRFVAIRETVLKLRKPRKEFVQAHTRLGASGDVELQEFDPSPAGVIESMVARHRDIPL